MAQRKVQSGRTDWLHQGSVLLQGERITQGVSYADVSDICLRALHDKAARNRTFEVRWLTLHWCHK